MSKYVILVNDLSDESSKAIADAVARSGAGWWHWMPHAWLLDDRQSRGVSYWSRLCTETAPGASVLVFAAAESPAAAGFLPATWHPWLIEHWT